MSNRVWNIYCDLLDLDEFELQEVAAFIQRRTLCRSQGQPEKRCRHCRGLFRGPLRYCSLRCAVGGAEAVNFQLVHTPVEAAR